MSSEVVYGLLEKMGSPDKDFRYMALNDLISELKSPGFRLDDRMQQQVVNKLVQLLDDKNGEVQNQAVKCLPPLVEKVKASLVPKIIDPLTQHVLTGTEQQRDISAIGLKAVIEYISPGSSADSFGKKLVADLVNALAEEAQDEVLLEILDIISIMTVRFGPSLASQHAAMLDALLAQMKHDRAAVRKRCTQTISCMVSFVPDAVFDRLLDFLIAGMTASTSGSDARTMVGCVSSVCRHAGIRMAPYLEKVVPLVVTAAGDEEDDELRESCIQAFEAFALTCSQQFAGFLPDITKSCLDCLQYDPNYNYDAEDDDDDMGSDFEDSDEEDYSDDDDQSWKVRRAAAKFLSTGIKTRPDLLRDFFATVVPVVIGQFKEREENVRVEVLDVMSTVLRQSQSADAAVLAALGGYVGEMMRFAAKLLTDKSIKTRHATIALLKDICDAAPGLLSAHVAGLVPGISFSLSDKSSTTNVKIETLELVLKMTQCNPATAFHPQITEIVAVITGATNDSFYKIASEALLVCSRLVEVIRPVVNAPLNPVFNAPIQALYDCSVAKLKATDVDQEVKERSIVCIGTLLSYAGDVLDGAVGTCLPILLARLQNEITSVVTTKTLAMMAQSHLQIDLSPILAPALQTMATFLRKKNRNVRVASLATLSVLIAVYGAAVDLPTLESILIEIPALADATDLHSSQLAISVVTSMISTKPELAAKLNAEVSILPAMLQLALSPLMQGGALDSLLAFLTAATEAKAPNLSSAQIMELFIGPVYGSDGSGMVGGADIPAKAASETEV